MLDFDPNWRYEAPGIMPEKSVDTIMQNIIGRISTPRPRKDVIEILKRRFAQSIGATTSPSSSESWADSDLRTYMEESAAVNAPLFIEALYDGLNDIQTQISQAVIPPWSFVNRHIEQSGFAINPPYLTSTSTFTPIAVPVRIPALDVQANTLIQKALSTSETFLQQGQHRAAVQEIFWLLETVSTAFRGQSLPEGNVTGKYFTKIISDLRRLHKGQTLDRISSWLESIYGYLSAPDGGGIRHGATFDNHRDLTQSEARLYCDLARSYISFLLAEYQKMSDKLIP